MILRLDSRLRGNDDNRMFQTAPKNFAKVSACLVSAAITLIKAV